MRRMKANVILPMDEMRRDGFIRTEAFLANLSKEFKGLYSWNAG